MGVRNSALHGEGTPADLRDARAGRGQKRPNKQGEYDGTVLVNDDVARKANRHHLSSLLRVIRGNGANEDAFSINIGSYERALKKGTQACGFSHLKLTPHSARHGGASHDALRELRSILDIQGRGLWASQLSVARYKKAGALLRQEQRLSTADFAKAEAVKRSLGQLIVSRALPPGRRQQPSNMGIGRYGS